MARLILEMKLPVKVIDELVKQARDHNISVAKLAQQILIQHLKIEESKR